MFVNPFGNPSPVTPFHNPHAAKIVNQPIKKAGNDLPRFLNYVADYTGCGHWRMLWPEQMLNAYRQCVIHSSTVMITDQKHYHDVSCIRVQRQASPTQKQFLNYLKENTQARLVYEIDDICFSEDIPDWNPFKEAFTTEETRRGIQEMMEMCDEMTVTCESMRQYFLSKTNQQNITVVPNYIPRSWCGSIYDKKQTSYKYDKNIKRPRVLYAGSSSHFDLKLKNNQSDDMSHVVDKIIENIHKYQWVFLGGVPHALKRYVEQGKVESHSWTHLYEYPYRINELNINAMIAPLQNNIFNRCKSDIKFLEAAACGIPIICQDICTYNNICKQLFTTGEDMITKLDELFDNKKKYMKIVESNYNIVCKRWLELNCNRNKFFEIYNFPYGSLDRKELNKRNHS